MTAWTPDQFWEYVGGLVGDFERDQMRDMLSARGLGILPPSPSDTISVPRLALQWLFGEQPGPDGKWFGETEPLPSSTRARPYWWRSKFRDMIPALSDTRPDRKSEA